MGWSWWSPRMVISWLDRNPLAEVAFVVPLTLVLLAVLAAHPFLLVVVALLVLGLVASVVVGFDRGQKREAEQQAQVAAGPQGRNRQSRADDASAQAGRMPSQWELEAEARARAQAAEAEALAAEARARAQAAEAEGSWWSPRMVISWLDRNPSVEVALAVPLTIVLLAALVAHPFLLVFVSLPVLGVVALAVMDFYEAQKSEVVHDAQVAGPQRRNPLSRADDARAQAGRMLSQ
jgi:hypothetical protein